MKKILFYLILLLLLDSCKEEGLDHQNVCEFSCENEKVIEIIDTEVYKIFSNQGDSLPFTLSPVEKLENNTVENDDILVPCNLPDNFRQDGAIVTISGYRKSCCNLLTLPNIRTSWGCKLEITSIEKLHPDEDLNRLRFLILLK